MLQFPFKEPHIYAELAIQAAMAANSMIVQLYKEKLSTSIKEDNSPLTEADLQSNKIIKKFLQDTGLPILSEEDKDTKLRLKHDKLWIIDPLDGTSDFVNKTGEFTTMIALVEKQKPVLGVISRPTTNTVFFAQHSKGAYKLENGMWKKLQVSKIKNLKKSRAVGSRFHLTNEEKEIFKKLGVLSFQSRGSSLKVTEICQGLAEIYLTTSNKIKQWDTCASYCLVNEAGGKMTDTRGHDIIYNTEELNHQYGLVVTNGFIHDDVIRQLR